MDELGRAIGITTWVILYLAAQGILNAIIAYRWRKQTEEWMMIAMRAMRYTPDEWEVRDGR